MSSGTGGTLLGTGVYTRKHILSHTQQDGAAVRFPWISALLKSYHGAEMG